jgi:hypothetical protein
MQTTRMQTDHQSDRRHSDRMPYATAMQYRTGMSAGLGKVINISPSGMFFETPLPLTAGDRLYIDFRFRNSNAAIEICGEITRTTPSGAAVRFIW